MTSQSFYDAGELLAGIAAIVEDESRKGLHDLSFRVITRVAVEWGGQKVYFPKAGPLRDRLFRMFFNGKNYNALARVGGVSENAMRRAISRQLAKERQERQLRQLAQERRKQQLSLFDFDKVKSA